MTAAEFSLDSKYTLPEGAVYLTGVQALVRLPLEQRRRDRAAGLDTAGFVSGYRGSPLATYDMQLWRAADHLRAAGVVFQPGLNEDLAVTAVQGTQQAELRGTGRHQGVFGIWYGKGPGVDRSGDALRHGNLAGSSPFGGVLLLLGDDHTSESSSTAHQSEYAMVDYMIPVLSPAGVQDLLDFGLYGIALSRFAGTWAAMKCVHDVVESAATISVGADRAVTAPPADFDLPPGGLSVRLPDTPLAQEERLHRHKLRAVQAFARANPIDRRVLGDDTARVGIVSTGKAHLDLVQALELLGLDDAAARAAGLAVYKVGLAWPLEPEGVRAFCRGLERVLVVEEKRALVETQLRDILYGTAAAPAVVGKLDGTGAPLLPSNGVLDAERVAFAIARQLPGDAAIEARAARLRERAGLRLQRRTNVLRLPHFCAGCPHNTSTKVPEGSRAISGTGCSYMVQWMERRTLGYTHMGADGATWIGEAPFSTCGHIIQNMGDGTYQHSGTLAIRAAVAAGVDITYKILFNDAVAMTGGQPHDGGLTVPRLLGQLQAEGVARVELVTDEPGKYARGSLPAGIVPRHRDELDAVQRELREVRGTSVLVYDQGCAAEKRRRRKRGTHPDPARRVFVNELVCEGCGDCGVQSNCIAIAPLDTEFGRKRTIDQSACNKDFSCLKGFCPSFVTVEGGRLRRHGGTGGELAALLERPLPEPALPSLAEPVGIVVAGVGGTGVLTLSAVLGTAAHLEGKGSTALDMTGLAQKGGAVVSHVRIGASPAAMSATRVGAGRCDLLLGCDLVVATGDQAFATLSPDRSFALLDVHERMVGAFTREPDLRLPQAELVATFVEGLGEARCHLLDATHIAERLLGDSMASNVLLLGAAFQLGRLPLSEAALLRAIELNGVAVAMNVAAFRLGRLHVADRAAVERLVAAADPDRRPLAAGLDEVIARREAFLVDYQDAAYAARYRALVERVRTAEQALDARSTALTDAVARSYFQLLACKDEYEVARLHADPRFHAGIAARIEGDYRLHVHLAPPLLARRDPVTGRPRKREFGPWMFRVFGLLARLKRLRGTWLDPFGHTAERRLERRLVTDFERLVDELLAGLARERLATATALAALPQQVRGFGPVKLAAVQATEVRRDALLAEFRAPAMRRAVGA